ncbi:MAG: TolC family protein [Muribaculaceae bacterium]|nr:TolC family protein [Muribaculaceae bacterium]
MKRYVITTLICLAVSFGISAQRILTLDECRALALENNVAIRNAGLMSKASHETRKEAFTKYFPNISLGSVAFTTNHGLLQHNFKGEIPVPPIPGITDGGVLDFDQDFTLLKKGISVGASLVQPVFMGGEIVNANKLTEIGEAVAELQSRQSADQVRRTVEQYYWQLAMLKAKQQTVLTVINLLDTLQYQVEVSVRAGVVLPNDLLEVKLRHNEVVTDSIKLANGINVLSSLLAQYVGLGVEPVDIAERITPENKIALDPGIYINPNEALSSTVDYQLLSQGVRAAEIAKRMTLGANLPKVAIGAGFSESNLAKQWHNNGTLFATVIIPVSEWWGGSHAIKRSKLNLQVARNNLSDASELLMVKMNNGWNNVRTSFRQIEVAEQSIEQASENLRLNELYYKAGTITVTDLLKSQTLYRSAHDQYIEAVGNYQVEITKYMIDTGR